TGRVARASDIKGVPGEPPGARRGCCVLAATKGNSFDMQGKQVFLIPLVFIAVLIPVMIAALLLFRPDESDADCDCAEGLPPYAAHSHGMALARENIDSMQLLFNVVAAAEVYDVQDGRLQPVAEPDPN